MSIKNFFRGLALLRYPEVVKDLGERRLHVERIKEIRRMAVDGKISTEILLIGFQSSRLTIGSSVSVREGTVLAFGDKSTGFSKITIGDGTWIGQYNNVRAGGGDISIGAHCLISQFCTLVASNHSTLRGLPIQDQPPRTDRAGVTIGDDVWIGAGATITPGVRVDTGAVCAAGSVITRDVPQYEIWGGVPAKKIGERK